MPIAAQSNDGRTSDYCGINFGVYNCDGNGDAYDDNAQIMRVGQIRLGTGNYRDRGFVTFDISSLADQVNQALLWIYYNLSYKQGVIYEAPDSSYVGHCIVDHIQDYGSLDASDHQITPLSSNIGTLIPDDDNNYGWLSFDITTYINADIAAAETPDTSCYRFRQSYEIVSSGTSNYWVFNTTESANPPYISIAAAGQIIRINII